jgi:hypothetical protein
VRCATRAHFRRESNAGRGARAMGTVI